MAKAVTIKVKLVSSADTGFYYVAKKNSRTMTDKLVKKKYDPVARKHVEFREVQDQIGLHLLRMNLGGILGVPFSFGGRRRQTIYAVRRDFAALHPSYATRHCEERSDEAIHASVLPRHGLLRGACHRARIRATRWLAMTVRSRSPE